MNPILKALSYGLSLPERTVRGLAGTVGGVSKLLTDSVLPRSLRGTGFYEFFLGNTQKFLIEGLGDVKTATPQEEKLPDDYVVRSIVGSVADGAGMFALQFSPLWFFAIAGDVAGGTKDYLRRIVAELKKDGVLQGDEGKIDTAEELLDALAHASDKSTTVFATPPIAPGEIRKMAGEIADGYRKLYQSGAKTLPRPADLWRTFEEIRKHEKVDLLKLMGTMTLASAKAAGKATGAMFYEKVLLSYADSLTEVKKTGFAEFFRRETAPYLDALGGHFSPAKKTWTEKLLSGELFRKKSQ